MDTIKDHATAFAVCGGLSKTSKMPCHSYSIPAYKCKTGGILRDVPNSTCSKCYACKGHYRFGAALNAMERRFASLQHPLWVEAMVFLINETDQRHFRWHDSGDIQNAEHLDNIIEVANRIPDVNFWLPTRESRLVLSHNTPIPKNLAIRISDAMIDGTPGTTHVLTSGVSRDMLQVTCPARFTGNKCGVCRACWDCTVPRVIYPLH